MRVRVRVRVRLRALDLGSRSALAFVHGLDPAGGVGVALGDQLGRDRLGGGA